MLCLRKASFSLSFKDTAGNTVRCSNAVIFFPTLSHCSADFTEIVTDVLMGRRIQFAYLCALRYSRVSVDLES